MEPLFTPDVQWGGGWYDLAFILDTPDEDRALEAREALWTQPALDGPYADNRREPWRQARVEPRRGLSDALFGVLTLHDGVSVPCRSQVIGSVFYLEVPVNGLQTAWPHAAYEPGSDAAAERVWQQPLEEWVAGIACAVFVEVQFRAAVIGFEAELPDEGDLRRWVNGALPDGRYEGVLLRRGFGLAWYPATAWDSF